MEILWHFEFVRDYNHFPQVEGDGIAPSFFTMRARQAKRYELWRRRQKREYSLHLYRSHFDDFLGYRGENDRDFFDFNVNILRRRHQGFIDFRKDEPVLLFSPGLLFPEKVEMEGFIEEAMVTGSLISCGRPGAGPEEVFSGFWVIPPGIQEEFAKPIPPEVMTNFIGDDVGYWWTLANRIGPARRYEIEGLDNYLPHYSRFGKIPTLSENNAPPMERHPYPAWTEADFLAWTNRRQYRLAKTMRWCPHEYVVGENGSFQDQIDFLMAIDYCYRNASVDEWRIVSISRILPEVSNIGTVARRSF